MHPRTIVLWIPLVFGYWITIGLRAGLLHPERIAGVMGVSSERAGEQHRLWVGTRAALRALILPPVFVLTATVTAPLLGLRVAAWHAAFVAVVLVAFIELVALTIDALPFTHPYRPGHAKLKTRWPLYLLGMFVVAYWPVRSELAALGGDELSLLAWPAAAGLAFHLAGRRAARKWSIEPAEDFGDDQDSVTILAIGPGAGVGPPTLARVHGAPLPR